MPAAHGRRLAARRHRFLPAAGRARPCRRDIHDGLDLLLAVEEAIGADIARQPPASALEVCPAGLKLARRLGDIMFVPAGIRPGVPVQEEAREDLLFIRGGFMQGDPPPPVRVVRGHALACVPKVRPFGIGVDTGASATGRLTAAVPQGDNVRFLSTASG